MIIEKLKVKNYKSLEDVEVPLRPLTVFVGPNNSGKSNTFDSLKFVRDLAFSGPQAVTSRGGFRDLVWGGDLTRDVTIQVEGHIEDATARLRAFSYQIGIAGGEVGYLISRETFALVENSTRQELMKRTGDNQFKTWSEQDPGQETGEWGLADPRLGISQVQGSRDPRHHTLASFASAVAGWRFYRFAPWAMGASGPARKEAYLSEGGENLASILISIQTEDRRTFSEIEGYLHAAADEIQELSMGLTEDNRAFFRWRERGLPSEFRIRSWMSSDGTRQILALLALRFSPKLPPLICIEEPENFIHPGLMELVADLLKSLSVMTQVLVSTHSPYLLNQLSPEDLVIIDKSDGRTQVNPVESQEGVKEALTVLGLGELWYSGHLGGVP